MIFSNWGVPNNGHCISKLFIVGFGHFLKYLNFEDLHF